MDFVLGMLFVIGVQFVYHSYSWRTFRKRLYLFVALGMLVWFTKGIGGY